MTICIFHPFRKGEQTSCCIICESEVGSKGLIYRLKILIIQNRNMNNNPPNYFDDANMQMGSGEHLQPRFNNQPQPNLPPSHPYYQPNNQFPPTNPYDNPYNSPYGQPPQQLQQPSMGYPPLYPQNQHITLNQPYSPPVSQPGPITYVVHTEKSGPICQYCHKKTSIISRKRAGCAVWSWSLCLLFFTCMCCWIPCVVDDCYDEELVCISCLGVRSYIPSKYGC